MTTVKLKDINNLVNYGSLNIDWTDYERSKRCYGHRGLEFLKASTCRSIDFTDVFEIDEVGDDIINFIRSLTTQEQFMLVAASGPNLWAVTTCILGLKTDVLDLCTVLRTSFPPQHPLPVIKDDQHIHFIKFAMGRPGDRVTHGLFPSRLTKVSRLLLAKSSYYHKETIINAAESAYDANRVYHAHDAVYCAAAHPEVDAKQMIINYAHENTRGWRSRRKSRELYRWAIKYGYVALDT